MMKKRKTRQPITLAQRRLLNFLWERKQLRMPMPTHREMADEFGWASSNSATVKLRVLEKKGYIRTKPGAVRAIEVLR